MFCCLDHHSEIILELTKKSLSEGPMAYLLGQLSVHPAVGCNAAKAIFEIICNYDIIYNNGISLHFFCFEGGEVDVNNIKKVRGNMGIQLKDQKHWELVNNLPVGGENFYNDSISYLSEKEKLSQCDC